MSFQGPITAISHPTTPRSGREQLRLGAVEGGLIGALVLYGAPPGPAAAAVLLYRAITLLLPTVLGAAAWGAMPLARLHRSAKRHEDLRYQHNQGAPAC
jgi:hypothetical protein